MSCQEIQLISQSSHSFCYLLGKEEKRVGCFYFYFYIHQGQLFHFLAFELVSLQFIFIQAYFGNSEVPFCISCTLIWPHLARVKRASINIFIVTVHQMTFNVSGPFVVTNPQKTIIQLWSSPQLFGALEPLLAHCFGLVQSYCFHPSHFQPQEAAVLRKKGFDKPPVWYLQQTTLASS